MNLLANFKNHKVTTIIGTVLAILVAIGHLSTNPDVSSTISPAIFHALGWVVSIGTFLGFGVAQDPGTSNG